MWVSCGTLTSCLSGSFFMGIVSGQECSSTNDSGRCLGDRRSEDHEGLSSCVCCTSISGCLSFFLISSFISPISSLISDNSAKA